MANFLTSVPFFRSFPEYMTEELFPCKTQSYEYMEDKQLMCTGLRVSGDPADGITHTTECCVPDLGLKFGQKGDVEKARELKLKRKNHARRYAFFLLCDGFDEIEAAGRLNMAGLSAIESVRVITEVSEDVDALNQSTQYRASKAWKTDKHQCL